MNIVNMQIMAKGSVIVKNIAKTGLLQCFDSEINFILCLKFMLK